MGWRERFALLDPRKDGKNRKDEPATHCHLSQISDPSGGGSDEDGPRAAVEHFQFAPPANEASILEILSADERAALDRLAIAWGMDADEKAIMLRQCERGSELADGSWISAEQSRLFWLAEAGAVR